jgi:hypothetical protein
MDKPLIPKDYVDLLSPERRAFADLALVLRDGTPQVTPVWFEWDGELIVINTARGRVKDKVLHRHPVVALLIADPANYGRSARDLQDPAGEGSGEGINEWAGWTGLAGFNYFGKKPCQSSF